MTNLTHPRFVKPNNDNLVRLAANATLIYNGQGRYYVSDQNAYNQFRSELNRLSKLETEIHKTIIQSV